MARKKSVKKTQQQNVLFGWKGIVAGIFIYFIWLTAVNRINLLSGPWQSAALYVLLFTIFFIWSIAAKNNSAFLAFISITLIIKCFDLLSSGSNFLGVIIFVLVILACFYGLMRKYLTFDADKKKNKASIIFFDSRPGIFMFNCLVIILLLAGVRENDIVVSKFYFNPWPIYADYVYPPDVEKVYFTSHDSTKLNGWLIPGKSTDAKDRPMLLYLHGNSGNMAAQYGQFEFLSQWGYDVFTFDYRGFGLSGGKVTRDGLWLDTKAAFRKMTELKPGRKYGVVGFSMGSVYALLLAANEQRVSSAVILTSFTSFRDIGKHNLSAWWGIPPLIADLAANVLVRKGLDPVDSAAAPGLPPAFIAHGTYDGTLPYAMGEKIAAIYSGKKTFLSMPQYNHGDYFTGPMAVQFRAELDNVFKIKQANGM